MHSGTVQTLLEVTDLTVRRRNGFAARLPALELMPGKVAALYGPSGCGKTSVLLGILDILDDAERTGRILLAGHDVSCLQGSEHRAFLQKDVIFLAQDAHAALDPLQPVGRQIEHGSGATPAAVREALLGLGVEAGVADRLPHEISGGQAQRVLLAMAFLRRPAIVFADEPSASLDGGSYAELVHNLRALLQRQSAVLLATHDHRLLRDLDADVYAIDGDRFLPASLEQVSWPERLTDHEVGEAPVLAARGLRKRYGDRVVLDGVDFTIRRGEVVAVIGESGAGKTTLARVLAAHCPPDAGEIERPPRPGAVQLCCQDALGSMTPGMTLGEMLAEASTPFFDLEHACRALQIAPRVLAQTGATMSGGERRRAILLRALAVHPDVLLLDEPTDSLDRDTANAVLGSLLLLRQSRGLTIVLVTHDDELARAFAHRVVEVAGGKLAPC